MDSETKAFLSMPNVGVYKVTDEGLEKVPAGRSKKAGKTPASSKGMSKTGTGARKTSAAKAKAKAAKARLAEKEKARKARLAEKEKARKAREAEKARVQARRKAEMKKKRENIEYYRDNHKRIPGRVYEKKVNPGGDTKTIRRRNRAPLGRPPSDPGAAAHYRRLKGQKTRYSMTAEEFSEYPAAKAEKKERDREFRERKTIDDYLAEQMYGD